MTFFAELQQYFCNQEHLKYERGKIMKDNIYSNKGPPNN